MSYSARRFRKTDGYRGGKLLSIWLSVGALLLTSCGDDDGNDSGDSDVTAGMTSEAKALYDKCSLGQIPEADSSVSGAPEPPADLVDKAEEEGSLTLFSAISEPTSIAVMKAMFEEQYPGITVDVPNLGGSSERHARFLADAEAGNQQADVITSQDKKFFADALSKDYLLPTSDVIEGFDDAWPEDWTWSYPEGNIGVISNRSFFFAVNTEETPAELMPKSWEDLAKPEYKDHLIMLDPNESSVYARHLQFLLDKMGKETFTKMVDNINREPLYSDGQVAAQALGGGAAWVLVMAANNVLQPLIDAGAPVEVVVADEASGPQYTLGVADGPHPSAAALYAHWMHSAEGQWAIACSTQGGAAMFPTTFGPPTYVPPVDEPDIDQINEIFGIEAG